MAVLIRPQRILVSVHSRLEFVLNSNPRASDLHRATRAPSITERWRRAESRRHIYARELEQVGKAAAAQRRINQQISYDFTSLPGSIS